MVLGILLLGFGLGLLVDRAFHVRPSALVADPSKELPGPLAPVADELQQLAEAGEWRALWRAIPGEMADGWRRAGPTVLALLTGACWLAFSMQAIQPRGLRDGRLWAPLVAAGLGVLSVWPTLFLVYWQEQRWGLSFSDELPGGIRFFVLGVGLREEAAKFVCFLPLLPWLVRRRDELAALVVAGCVGIGFAMEENDLYFGRSLGADAAGRLLTAAPLHMALTGLVGLAAYRACVWPKQWALPCVAFLGVMVLAHGLYDAFIALPALVEYSLAGMMIFVFVVYQYFHELRPKRAVRGEPISLTANFLFCVTTVVAATFVYMSGAVGWEWAADALFVGIVGQAVMVYLFLREMPETMVAV
jgi:RsiW-degrading membrane proteinase PrsW (M82 family)